jgi:hypothetical protein
MGALKLPNPPINSVTEQIISKALAGATIAENGRIPIRLRRRAIVKVRVVAIGLEGRPIAAVGRTSKAPGDVSIAPIRGAPVASARELALPARIITLLAVLRVRCRCSHEEQSKSQSHNYLLAVR